VVGTGSATKEIKSGDKVRVDGDKGVVTILS
jgi:pyruvate,water dikinase